MGGVFLALARYAEQRAQGRRARDWDDVRDHGVREQVLRISATAFVMDMGLVRLGQKCWVQRWKRWEARER